MLCDFCGTAAIEGLWMFPYTHFKLGEIDSSGRILNRIDAPAGLWGCCDECANCVERAAVDELLDRAVKAHVFANSNAKKNFLKITGKVYQALLVHRAGPPAWMTKEHWDTVYSKSAPTNSK